MANTPIATGIIGLGRSGWGIHADVISRLPDRFQVAAVYDPINERAGEAAEKLSCTACASLEALLDRSDIELVVVASPNRFHATQAIQALEAGKHVLCEKPFGFTTADVDAMTAAAKRSGVVLQPFQQRRFEPDFQKVKEICDSGRLGRITFVRICWHGFGRRWDWQTSRAFGGGQLYNNGPHLIDHAVELFGPADPRVACKLQRSLASGDAEDELIVTLTGPESPTVTVELLATAAFPHDRWLVCGTAGSLRGTGARLEWKWVDWSGMPERPQDLNPTPDRSYNRESLEWQEDAWEADSGADGGAGAPPAWRPAAELYTDLWGAIREGRPQRITPEQVRRRVAVLQRCYEINDIPFPEGARLNGQRLREAQPAEKDY